MRLRVTVRLTMLGVQWPGCIEARGLCLRLRVLCQQLQQALRPDAPGMQSHIAMLLGQLQALQVPGCAVVVREGLVPAHQDY